MRLPIRLSCTLFTASLLTAATANLASMPAPAATDPIARLNECIQQRFQSATSFGMSRVLPYRADGVQQFHPENPTESQILTDLRRNGYEVTLFLVGRYALDTPPPIGDTSRYGLQGPAFMTAATKDLPDSHELLAEGQKALVAFSKRDGYDLHKGEWTMAMRPLRATNVSCVQCHTSGPADLVRDSAHAPKTGDALGVAMYIYRTAK